jgi:hypothetical protein
MPKINLPESFEVHTPAIVGGAKVTFTLEDIEAVINDVIRNGLKQKLADALAGATGGRGDVVYKGDNAFKDDAGSYIKTGEDLANMFRNRFARGVWNMKASGGGRRSADAFETWLKAQAMTYAKDFIRAGKVKQGGIAYTKLDDSKLILAVRDNFLAKPAWVAARTAEYVPVKHEDDEEINLD